MAFVTLTRNLLQLKQQEEERCSGNLDLDWPPGNQIRPQAMSSPNQIGESNNFLQAVSEDPELDDAMLNILDDQHQLVRLYVTDSRKLAHGCDAKTSTIK
jgi:hypothetical protein